MIYSVIMAGGIGSRFWPLSRQSNPKQFLSIINESSLLEDTINRLTPLIPDSRQTIVTTEALKSVFPEDILSRVPRVFWEPMGKNTAPCIGWAALSLLKEDPEAVLVIIPSDQWVSSVPNFTETIQAAIDEAISHETIVTIGIPASSPHTGYGYIEVVPQEETVKQVKSFTEKPDHDTASQYIRQGNYYWNSGMFIAKAKTLVDQFKIHLPEHYALLEQITSFDKDDPKLSALYQSFESISIDYGIMEKATALTRLIPALFEWNDIGSWSSLDQFLEKDESQNAVQGKLLSINSSNNIVYSPKKLVAISNVRNMIIVNTDDALLILPKEHDQKIKDIYKKLDQSYQ
jgi:mannose-1-phosphate guanylyltransferase